MDKQHRVPGLFLAAAGVALAVGVLPAPAEGGGGTVSGATAASNRGAAGRIAFTSDRDGKDELYVMNAKGGRVRRLTDMKGYVGDAAWSPDGRRIAFVRYPVARHRMRHGQLYVMRANGSSLRRLTRDWTNGDPAWSPDGRRIAFTFKYDLWVIDADGGHLRTLAAMGFNSGPSWSPDGRQIAFASTRDDSLRDALYVMAADGGDVRQLTDVPGSYGAPAWSPDGRRIAFVRANGSKIGLYVMAADGAGVRRVTFGHHTTLDRPSWSPDGRRIAFTSDRADGSDVWVVDAAGRRARRLTRSPASDRQPAWWGPARRRAHLRECERDSGPCPASSSVFDSGDAAHHQRAVTS